MRKNRNQFADKLSHAIGVGIVVGVIFLLLLQTALLSFVPFPQTAKVSIDLEEFMGCFEEHSKLAETDSVTSYRRDVTKPENRIRLVQMSGFFGPQSYRSAFIDQTQDGFLFVDGYYELASSKSSVRAPIRKYDWFVFWLCNTEQI